MAALFYDTPATLSRVPTIARPVPPHPESATRQRTRQAILDAAAHALVRSRDASVMDVATIAGTSRSTVHRYFRERAELVDAVVLDSVRVIGDATARARLDQGDAIDGLRRLLAEYLDVGDRIRVLLDDPSLAATYPTVDEMLRAEGPVIGVIERGQAEGSLDGAVPAAWIERVLWALLYTACEAVDDGTLSRLDALTTTLRSLEHGIRAHRPAP